jgi:hypothetical protein
MMLVRFGCDWNSLSPRSDGFRDVSRILAHAN